VVAAVTISELSEAIDPLRGGFNADGADLVVESATEESAVVRLVVTDETCLSCIVPYDTLTFIITGTVTKHFPQIRNVEVIDPRKPKA
jgi:Fe-S cluster biogenesis protein NfuA